MNKFFSLFFLLLTSAIVFGQTALTTTEINNFKNSVNIQSKALQTLTANFVQTKHISFLNKPIIATGSLYLKKDKLRWQYLLPIKYVVVFKSPKLLVNNQGKHSTVDLTKNKQFEKLSKLISGSVNGSLFNNTDFEVLYYKTETDYFLKLKPINKDLAKYIKAIELYFDKENLLVNQSKMIEPNDDYTVIIFKDKVLNQPINDSVFSL